MVRILKNTNLIIGSMVVLVAGLLVSGMAIAEEIENLMENGGFENGTYSPWQIGGGIKNDGGIGATMEVVDKLKGADVDEDTIEGKLCLLVGVEDGAASAGDVQFMTANHPSVY